MEDSKTLFSEAVDKRGGGGTPFTNGFRKKVFGTFYPTLSYQLENIGMTNDHQSTTMHNNVIDTVF